MADVDTELAAYELMRPKLEADHTGKWALVHDRELIALFDDFDSAAADAVRRFGRGPYLIRQVGAPPVTLPASVAFNVLRHADN